MVCTGFIAFIRIGIPWSVFARCAQGEWARKFALVLQRGLLLFAFSIQRRFYFEA